MTVFCVSSEMFTLNYEVTEQIFIVGIVDTLQYIARNRFGALSFKRFDGFIKWYLINILEKF